MNQASHVLEEIRRTELEAARQIEKARESAEQIIAEARDRARRQVEEGRERGRQDASGHLERAIADAEERAAVIRDSGVSEAERLSGLSSKTMEPVVDEMVQVVLAPPSEPGR